MSLRVRPVEARDRARILELAQSIGFFTAAENAVVDELLGIYLDRAGQTDYHFVSAVDDADGPIGFLCYGPTPMTNGTWDLYWIVTDAKAHGRGIGTAMLRAVEMDLDKRGARLVVIETSSLPAYEATRNFYLGKGYVQSARIEDFYTDGDARIIYTRRGPFAGRA